MKNFFLLAIIALIISSCGEDPKFAGLNKYTDPAWVVNQGQFNAGSGSITYKKKGDTTLIHNAYSANNDGAELGNIIQSMILHKGNYYFAINNGASVVVAGEKYLDHKAKINGIKQPRYFASNGNSLYVSAWIDGFGGTIYQLDNTGIKDSIVIGGGPEGMIIDNDLLYVAKNGGYGLDSTVVIIDLGTKEVVKTLQVGYKPEIIAKGIDGNIYVICGGKTDWNNPENNTPGALVTIANQEITNTIPLSNGANKLAIDHKENTAYFIMDGTVKKQNLDSTSPEITSVVDIYAYSLGFDDSEGLLYVGDAKDFVSTGEVTVIDRSNQKKSTFEAGIVPGFFYFK